MSPEGRQLIAHLSGLDAEITRQRRLRLSLRALWIGGLALALGMIARSWAGWSATPAQLALIVAAMLLIGLVYAWMPTRGPAALARSFDRAYALDQQMATALEINANQADDGMAALLTEQARRRLAFITRDVEARIGEPLRLELHTLALVLVLAAGIFLLTGLRSSLPTAAPSSLRAPDAPAAVQPPGLPGQEPPGEDQPPGGERPAANQPGQGPARLDEAGRQAADALSGALRDNGATRAAADALDRGDTARAAEELRRLADQAGDLSPQARNDIADALDRAANQLQADQPDLAERLRRDANQLRSDNPGDAASGLDDLARAVEDLGRDAADSPEGSPAGQPDANNQGAGAPQNENGAGQPGQGNGADAQQPQEGGGSGAGSGSGGGGRTSPPPQANGQDLPLPPAPDAAGPTAPGQGRGDATITLPGDGSSGGGGGQGGQGGSVPDNLSDPATIPTELRDAIQTYFEGNR